MKQRTCCFSLLQGFYWFGACLVYAYAERLLLSYGFQTGTIGAILSAAYLSAMVLQPALAAAADRERRVTLRLAITVSAPLSAFLALGAWLGSGALAVFAVLLGAMSSVTLAVQPLVNAVGFHYINRGLDLDYSFARGAASVVYALASLLFGALAARRIESMLWVYAAVQLGLFLTALFFAPHRAGAAVRETDGSLQNVFRRYPAFVLFCAGVLVLNLPHMILNAYLKTITSVTGGDMSVMIAVAAIVEFPAMTAYSHIRRRIPDRVLLIASASVYLLKTGLMLLAAYLPIGGWAVYVSSALQMLCYAIFTPAASYYANDCMGEADRVKGQMLLTEAGLAAGVISMLLGGIAGFAFWNIAAGSTPMTLSEVFDGLINPASEHRVIVMDVRMVRIVPAILLGGALALSGFLLQTFFSNPIAGPFTLGISSGAKLVLSVTMIAFLSRGVAVGSVALILASFVGAMLSMGFVLAISYKVKRMSMLIICGVMIGYICSAITEFVIRFADDSNIVKLHDWAMGSFAGLKWDNVLVIAAVVLPALVLTFLLSKPIGAYQLGEVYARNMGVNIKAFRIALILLSGVLSACVTAFAGPISFVGVAVPFLCRRAFGTSLPQILIPATVLAGAAFCLGCDWISRMALAPAELPLGVVTSLTGAPVVVVMLLERQRGR